MYPELVTRPDLEVFLPPIGGIDDLHLRRRRATSAIPRRKLTCRVHDECNGSDVFGSDICTCRPYLAHGIEDCIEMAQQRRRRPGRLQPQGRPRAGRGDQVPGLQRAQAPGRRRHGGDQYFARTECVAGVQDMRFQELMPDVLHWLGITQIDRFVSMSNMKYDAHRASRASRSASACRSPTS